MRRTPLAWVACLLMVISFLTACSGRSDFPQWFDAIHRIPVKTVLVDGYRLAYIDAGTGPPVILIHGFGGSLWQWEYQQAQLSIDHRVITLDLLGSGLSDKPDIAYTPTRLVESFRGFMDALGIPRASLVGNSMGAGLVIGMVLTHPARVDRIVLIDGLPDQVKDKLSSPLMRRALDTWAPRWLVNLGNRMTGRDVTHRVLSEMVHDIGLLTPAVIDRSYRNRQRPGLLNALRDLAERLPEWEEGFARRLGQISHRTLIIWGAQDKVFPPEVGTALSSTIPHASFVVIPETGHIPMWEKPELVNPLLREYLRP